MSDHYTYRVLWSPEDNEFVGQCAEFPSLSHLAPDQVEALVGIRALVCDVVADMRSNGEPVPEPFADRTYSGRFVARVPSDLHRRLAPEAAEEGVSLNRLVSNKLAARPVPVFKQQSPSPKTGAKKRSYA
jgi:predicted HicB family RNase H-like nuclease